MEEQNITENQVQQQNFIQETLPNSSGVLAMGIISIAGCWCYGLIALILGIIALVLSGKSMKLYNAKPGKYSESSYKNLKAGRVCAIIGTSLSAMIVFVVLIYVLIVGAALGTIFSTLPWESYM
ncbi:MAG: CCC motif membrane protein [Bacteroidota bacterium]|nr:CCC motif membrane protein [Bacteroidota bacterium]